MSDMNPDNIMANEEGECFFGEKLRSTRESMGISIQDAAARLHLSPRFIIMLENENLLHTQLPPIYLRGYLRSYSKLLNISEQELVPIMEKLNPKPEPAVGNTPSATTPDSLPASFPLEYNPYFARIATVIVSLMLLTGMSTWWYHHANSSSATVIALNQPLILESSNPATSNKELPSDESITPSLNSSNPNSSPSLVLNNVALNNQNNESIAVAPVNLTTQKPLALASTTQTSDDNPSESAKNQDATEDDSSDEQE